MAIDFPNTPSTGQTFTSGSRTWTYDGAKWNLTAYGVTGPQGATGPQGPSGTGLVICTFSPNTRPTSPTVGQNIYETDTGRHLVYYGATTGWLPPWDMPWGNFASSTPVVTTTTSSTLGTALTNVPSLVLTTLTLPANRVLRWTVSGHAYHVGGSADLGRMQVYSGSTGGAAVTGGTCDIISASTTVATTFSWSFTEVTPSVGSLTRRVTYIRQAGSTGNVQFFADATRVGRFTVEDIGPDTIAPPSP